jgi:hypothetical protein
MKLNVPHALPADTGVSNLNVTLVADLPFETLALQFATPALEALGRSKYDLAEESVRLRFATPVVKRLSLGHLSVRPAAYFLR